MGTKHDVLTEAELRSFRVSLVVRRALDAFLEERGPSAPRSSINILDWGCGRGRSVARLREEGFNAYGVDIDRRALRNGYPLFRSRGLNPDSLLLHVDQTPRFPDGFFHFIFSEQVFEHIEDLPAVTAEIARLTRPEGAGVHCFPGARNILEGHLRMPLVHWLPKNGTRRMAIAVLLLFRIGPTPPWPETRGRSFWQSVDVYYRYLDSHTHYRDVECITAVASGAGLVCRYEAPGLHLARRRWLPLSLRRNGFPRGSIRLFLHKEARG
jgi:SAM-dependent methyltransferase